MCQSGNKPSEAELLEQWKENPSVEKPLAGLDVSVLQKWLLESSGVPHEAIKYWADPNRAVKAVDLQEADMAWFVRGIPLQQVYDLAQQGYPLAPKSTYFYPKVPSGLTINAQTPVAV